VRGFRQLEGAQPVPDTRDRQHEYQRLFNHIEDDVVEVRLGALRQLPEDGARKPVDDFAY